TLCQDLVNSGTDHVESNLLAFFEPVPPVLNLLQEWSGTGLLDFEDSEGLTQALVPVLDSLPQITGLSVGFSDGSGYFLSRDQTSQGHYQTQTVSPETSGVTSIWTTGIGSAAEPEKEVREDRYDPRERPWFRGAFEDPNAAGIHWTDPYLFFDREKLGMTASIPLEDANGRSGVISLDLLLDDISRLGETLEVSPNGFLIVVTEDVKLIGLPRHPDLQDEKAKSEAYLKTPGDLGIPLFTYASLQFLKRFDLQPGELLSIEVAESEANAPFRWSFEGEGWWSYVRACAIEGGPLLWIGVALPESDFL
ncbi:MAG: hypothetical protein AAF357_15940, partial [Verrucomicrobiota bacterium]